MTKTGTTETGIQATSQKLSAYFLPNIGQLEEKQIFYEAKGATQSAFFTPGRMIYTFFKQAAPTIENAPSSRSRHSVKKEKVVDIRCMRLDFRFLHANPETEPTGRKPLPGKVNVFKGNAPSKWATNVPLFQEIVSPELWPGIDLIFRGEQGRIKYEFVVHPGAKLADIQFTYDGAKMIAIDEEGNLLLDTLFGVIKDERPVSYQLKNNQKVLIQTSFQLEKDEQGEVAISFRVADNYDKNHPLIIDPELIYSSYLGGNGDDEGTNIVVDVQGNAYVTGITESPTGPFPILNAFQVEFGGDEDGFVTKVSPDGQLLYSSYLGGDSLDHGQAITVDASGNAYITGSTSATLVKQFPTLHPFQDENRGGFSDAFVMKVNPAGELVYSSFLGGSSSDGGLSITLDPRGHAYVTGFTSSSTGTFPIRHPFQPSLGGAQDAFVAKIGDIQPPVILCPEDLTVVNDPGRNGARVQFKKPSVQSESRIVKVFCSPASGSFFPRGTTTVTCTAIDEFGNTSTCSFNVTVIIDPCRFFFAASGRRETTTIAIRMNPMKMKTTRMINGWLFLRLQVLVQASSLNFF